jgi:hypothetical protein
LRKSSSYKEFSKGYFRNVPDMSGYIYKFKCGEYSHIYLIVDTSNCGYSKDYYKKDNYYFLVYKTSSLDNFLKGFFEISSEILDRVNSILDKDQENADERAGGIPHGYKIGSEGDIVIDPVEAIQVKKIYKLYTQYGSIRKIASELKTNFSHVRDVLHDYRYERIQPCIIPNSILKKARQLMDKNRKNRTT